jgi:hypothetical protein
MVFNFNIFNLYCLKILFKFLLASTKTLNNSADYSILEAASEFPSPPTNKTGGNLKRIMKLNLPLEKADSKLSTCYFDNKYCNMRKKNNLRVTEQFSESQAASCMPQEAI